MQLYSDPGVITHLVAWSTVELDVDVLLGVNIAVVGLVCVQHVFIGSTKMCVSPSWFIVDTHHV